MSGDATLDLPYEYAGIIDLYFAATFLPDAPERTTVVTLHNNLEIPSVLSDPSSQKPPNDVLGGRGRHQRNTRLRIYAGPKEMDVLNSIHAIGADGKPTGQPSIRSSSLAGLP